jgi:allantoin racemase
MRILLLNPNLTSAVTESCARAARAAAAPGTEIVPVTGTFGAEIINSRAENAIAAHMVLSLAAQHAGTVDAVLLAVSYDTALYPARELLDVPVVGMTEAALVTALLVGVRAGLVVFGTPGLYQEHVAALGLQDRLAGIRVINASPGTVYSDPNAAQQAVLDAAHTLVEQDHADVVVLCGAAMAGMAAVLQPQAPVPLLDGISCAVPLCEMLVRLKLPAARLGSLARPGGRATRGLDPALAALLVKPSA